jgi:putative tricarboxylic transport membrane protein
MKKEFKDFCIGIVFCLLGIYTFFESARIRSFESGVAAGDPGVAFFPKGISIFLIALSIILIVKNFQSIAHIKLSGSVKKIGEQTVNMIKANRVLLGCMLLLALYPYVVTKIGYLTTSLLFAVALLKMLSSYSWIKILLTSGVFVFACYGIFTYLFSVPLP